MQTYAAVRKNMSKYEPLWQWIKENGLKPFVVGRKNWMFATSVKGAQSSAMAYSVISTAAANGYDVKEYLTNLFQNRGGQPPIKSE